MPVAQLNRQHKARIGLVPQENNLDPDLSVRQNLEVYGRYFSLPADLLDERIPELLDFMQLGERVESGVNQLSGGMKRRLVLARALISSPELVILDEPTTGLDPQARVMIWKRLLDLKRQGLTLLLTTHYMDEAQRLCDEIIVIDHGRILDRGRPQDLIDRHVKGHVFEVQSRCRRAFAMASGSRRTSATPSCTTSRRRFTESCRRMSSTGIARPISRTCFCA